MAAQVFQLLVRLQVGLLCGVRGAERLFDHAQHVPRLVS